MVQKYLWRNVYLHGHIIGFCLKFEKARAQICQTPLHPPPTLPLQKFRTLCQVWHVGDTMKIRHHRFEARNNLCQWLNRCKMPQTPCYEWEKFKFWAKKWAKFPTKAQKSSKDDFIREIKRPVQETGRLVSYPGHSHIIREGWHVWEYNIIWFYFFNPTCSPQVTSIHFLPINSVHNQRERLQEF